MGRRRLNGLSAQCQSSLPLDLAHSAAYVFALDTPELLRTVSTTAEVAVPRIRSAAKRMRQARTRAAQNRTHRSQLRTALKKVRTSRGAEAETAYAEAVKLLDRAGQKSIIHKNAAARQKSRLAKFVAGAAEKK